MRQIFVLIVLGGLGLAAGCSSGGGSTPTGVPTGGTNNVLSIAVDGGPNPAQNGLYANGAFASATICNPNSTSSCVTVDHLLVDTGSFGLRVLQSAISTLSLPTVNASNGSAAYDCAAFADGSFLWGPVQKANLTLSGETATNVPIQVVENPTGFSIPTSCANGATNEDTQASLGANGILGVGLEPFDCGLACDPANDGGRPPSTAPAYYTCSSAGCTPASVSCGSECSDSAALAQVTNPVVLFSVDNNGVIVELPSVSGSAATLTGSLIFGIGTESNNQLSSSANVYTLACDDFNTIFENQTFAIDPSSCTGPGSFIDSGSNGLFFPDVTSPVIPTCPSSTPEGDLSSFYCPTSLMNLSAVNEDPNTLFQGPGVSFSVDNAETLFSSDNAALGTLGGVQPSGAGFDWGLPFFYGRNVYSAIDGQSVPTNAAAPWWAY